MTIDPGNDLIRDSVQIIRLESLCATGALARQIAPLLRQGDMICIKGVLGAGKTAFARALIQCLLPGEEVPSPTFTLIQSYEGPNFPILHADLYRLESHEDVWELGWDDAINGAVMLVEWPERLSAAQIAPSRLEIEFLVEGEGQLGEEQGRVARLCGFGSWAERARRIGIGA